MSKILVINGSYREGGVTDQVIDTMVDSLKVAKAEVETIFLRDYPIKFCLNCRECTQYPGNNPAECVLNDDMQELVNKIEKSDAYIFASPTNFGSVTAVFKRFMERLIVYGYWPWGTNSPKYRKADTSPKKALLVSSCAAPGFLGRWLFKTDKQLKTTAQIIGAKSIGIQFIGFASAKSSYKLSKSENKKAQKLSLKLLHEK